ncbi:MAG: hypothetical protein EBT03_12215, partial [Betaproteobacteria bacterium]|nr:hypothetical protein [Betaproteobacteria bacterium]
LRRSGDSEAAFLRLWCDRCVGLCVVSLGAFDERKDHNLGDRNEGKSLMAAYIGNTQTVPTGATSMPLRCDACGEAIGILMPAAVNSLAAMIRAFEDAHCECEYRYRAHSEEKR